MKETTKIKQKSADAEKKYISDVSGDLKIKIQQSIFLHPRLNITWQSCFPKIY